jgi:hypothetical protein
MTNDERMIECPNDETPIWAFGDSVFFRHSAFRIRYFPLLAPGVEPR